MKQTSIKGLPGSTCLVGTIGLALDQNPAMVSVVGSTPTGGKFTIY